VNGEGILRKEEITMTYVKPEAMVLGSARNVIEHLGIPKQAAPFDSVTGLQNVAPAYDLDE
jgi:hypothetical protein